MPDYVGGGYDRGSYRSPSRAGTWQLYACEHPGDNGWQTVNTTNEVSLRGLPFEGGLLGDNGILAITAMIQMTLSSNAKTFKIKYGGISFYNVSHIAGAQGGTIRVEIMNRANPRAQAGGATNLSIGFGVSGQSCLQTTIDTTAQQMIEFTGQAGSAAEFAALMNYRVEFMRLD